jgi:V-type H+-transporting ATPase subunit D
MADTAERLDVMPSRMVLQGIKEKLSAARTGHSLLKRKSDAIKIALQNILKKILVVKRRVGTGIREAAFSHTEAVWGAGDFNSQVIESTTTASYVIRAKLDNIAGVKIPIFERAPLSTPSKEVIVGLSRGGQQVVKCKANFTKALDDLVQLASLQTSLRTLDEALKVTNRRVNALEFVVMPKLQNTIKYIQSELDELEREDTYRIKKVKDLRSQNSEDEPGRQKTPDDTRAEGNDSQTAVAGDDEDIITDAFD